jgi:hypothetical protein
MNTDGFQTAEAFFSNCPAKSRATKLKMMIPGVLACNTQPGD